MCVALLIAMIMIIIHITGCVFTCVYSAARLISTFDMPMAKTCRTYITGGFDANSKTVIKNTETLREEYHRYIYVKKIIDAIICFLLQNHTSRGAKIKYEAINLAERLLLAYANNAEKNNLDDPILNNYNYSEYIADLKYQKKTKKFIDKSTSGIPIHINDIRAIIDDYNTQKKTVELPDWYIRFDGDISTFSIGSYSRTISSSRMRLLLTIGNRVEVANMLMRYACIISRSQHWEAPIEYFRILYSMGVRFEGFSSPVNSNFLLGEFKNTHMCSLFYDTDHIFRSLGSFFRVDFVSYYTESFTPSIVVGPPYYDELILDIAKRVVHQCTQAKHEQKKIRFIITHSNSWDYSEGFALIKNSKFLSFDHIFKRDKHYYNNDKGVHITARFDTRLFVMEYGCVLTANDQKKIIGIFPGVGK